MKIRYTLPLIALLAACSGTNKSVGTVAPDRAIGSWQVITTAKDQDNGLCYAFSAPLNSHGSYTGKRTAPYVMATRRQSGKIEISVSSGYSYKRASLVELEAGGKSFALKAKDNVAWAQNDAQDKQLLAALRKSAIVDVSGTVASGATTIDSYSTAGFADALARVKALCP